MSIQKIKPNYTTVINTQVQETKDYQVFKLDIKNRPINRSKVYNFR